MNNPQKVQTVGIVVNLETNGKANFLALPPVSGFTA
jgi:hypothetical protein